MKGSSWFMATLALVFGVATGAKAQETVDFGRLSASVRRGDALIVTDTAGRQTQSQVVDASPESLMRLPGLTSSGITEIAVERRDSIWNGALIGLAVVGTPWLIACAANDWCYYNEYGAENLLRATALTTAAIGAGIGALIDLSRRQHITLYRVAPGPTLSIGVLPSLSASGTSVRIAVGF